MFTCLRGRENSSFCPGPTESNFSPPASQRTNQPTNRLARLEARNCRRILLWNTNLLQEHEVRTALLLTRARVWRVARFHRCHYHCHHFRRTSQYRAPAHISGYFVVDAERERDGCWRWFHYMQPHPLKTAIHSAVVYRPIWQWIFHQIIYPRTGEDSGNAFHRDTGVMKADLDRRFFWDYYWVK